MKQKWNRKTKNIWSRLLVIVLCCAFLCGMASSGGSVAAAEETVTTETVAEKSGEEETANEEAATQSEEKPEEEPTTSAESSEENITAKEESVSEETTASNEEKYAERVEKLLSANDEDFVTLWTQYNEAEDSDEWMDYLDSLADSDPETDQTLEERAEELGLVDNQAEEAKGSGGKDNPDGDSQECDIQYYNSNSLVYWDTMSYNSTKKSASENHSAYTHITSVKLNSTSVTSADSSGTSWPNGTALSTYFPRATTSNDVETTLEITPAAGYYVTHIVIACTGNDGGTSPYSCNTFAAGNAFDKSFSFKSTGAMTATVKASDFSHKSKSGNYFILIQVAPIPSPLYVEYDYGDIVTNIGNGTHDAFDTASGWTSAGSGNNYGTGEAQTYNTQYKYAYADGLTDEQKAAAAAAWKHTTNSITQTAAEQAAAAGYYFTGWKFTYYSGATAENSSGSYNNYTYTFSGSIGEGNVAENASLTLLTNVKLVAQWAPITLTVTKKVSGLPDSNSDAHTYKVQVQKLTSTDADGEETWTTITPTDVEDGTKEDDGTISLSVTGNASTTATLSGGITSGTYRVVETSGNDDLTISNTKYTCSTACSDSVEVKYGSYSGLSLTVTNSYETVKYEPVNFFINLDSKILDTSGSTTGQDKGNFTTSVSGSLSAVASSVNDQGIGVAINENLVVKLPSSHVHSSSVYEEIAGTSSTSAKDVDTKIRALENGTNNTTHGNYYQIVNKTTGVGAFPSDKEIFKYIRDNYTTENSNGVNKGKSITLNGEAIDISYLTEEYFAIRWYVFKDQNGAKDDAGNYIDCWHIDGILVAKSGVLEVTKTFPSQEIVDKLASTFEIDVTGNFLKGTTEKPNTTITRTLTQASSSSKNETTGEVTYTWSFNIFGSSAEVEEKNYETDSTYYQEWKSTSWTYTSASGSKSTGSTKKAENLSITSSWTDAQDSPNTQTLAYVNNYGDKAVSIDLKKISANDTAEVKTELDGAVFNLYKGTETTVNDVTTVTYPEEATRTVTVTANSGTAEFGDLTSGVYKLVETKAPEGYSVLSDPIYFKIANGVLTLCNENGEELETNPTMWELDSTNSSEFEFVLTIQNSTLYDLPSTGGLGIYTVTFGGMLLMMCSAFQLIMYRTRMQRRRWIHRQ